VSCTRTVCRAAVLVAALLIGGCTARYQKASADREMYGIIGDGERSVFGKKSGFNVDTPYSKRKPSEIPPGEIVSDRIQDGRKFLSVEDALRIAIGNSRQYQFRKETLYLTSLNLARERYDFSPHPAAGTVGTVNRNSDKSQDLSLNSRLRVDQMFKTGARFSAALANDITAYFVGGSPRTAISMLSVALTQPLLRGAGASIVGEQLTQAERNVVYEVRGFSRFQTTFSVDIVISYLRLLQQKDTVRNEHNSYKNAIASRELSEALGFDGRVSRVQVDQARQRELDLRNRYLLAVERYRDTVDSLKTTLGLPLGVDLQLDDKVLDDFTALGLEAVQIGEKPGYAMAVQKRLDLLNEIDRFEDAQRKIKVAANQLKTDLNLFATAAIDSNNPDYTKFDWDNYRATAGFTLNLPLDRYLERYNYRASFINFERQLRTLAEALDEVRDNVRQGVRGLVLARTSYEVQRRSVELAEQRVESANMLFQAGRVQIRDLLDAQDAQLRARNAFSLALIEYHAARLGLLRDLGVLDVDDERFWVKTYALPRPGEAAGSQLLARPADEMVTPEQLFGNE